MFWHFGIPLKCYFLIKVLFPRLRKKDRDGVSRGTGRSHGKCLRFWSAISANLQHLQPTTNHVQMFPTTVSAIYFLVNFL